MAQALAPQPQQHDPGLLAPVDLGQALPDAVSHSLAVLATVYNYNHWIFDSLRADLGGRIAEIGAGIGNITQFLLNAEQVVCLEPFEPYRGYLARRFVHHRNVTVAPRAIEDCPGPDAPAGAFDSVVCLNVLEHIEDDVAALTRMRQLTAARGNVIILVPALPWLFGAMDQAMGHFRRYTRGSLSRAMKAAGLKVRRCRYLNLLGVLGWWVQGRLLRGSRIPASATRTFDRLVPILSAIERLVPVPIGQSVLAVGTAHE